MEPPKLIIKLLLLSYFITCIKTQIDGPNKIIAQIEYKNLDYKEINDSQLNENNDILAEVLTNHVKTEKDDNKTGDLYKNLHVNDKLLDDKEITDNIAKERLELVINRKYKLKLPIVNKTPKKMKEPKTLENLTKTDASMEKTVDDDDKCIGQVEYCNLTREEYIAMMNAYIYPQPYEWVLIATHSIVFVVGLIGNALVCVAVYRNHSMRTVTNYFIVNLAVADFMVILICLPPTVLWDVTETWFLGEGLCKILLYFQSVSVTVSVLTLTFISVDRWYAICFPLKFKSTTGRAKTAILIIWIISLIFNSSELVVLKVVRNQPLRFNLTYLVQCTSTWSNTSELVWHIVKILFIYTLPLFLMTVAYCQIVRVLWSSQRIPGQAEDAEWSCAEQSQLRSRRKAAKMLVAVVVMFAVCYFPVHLLSVVRYSMVIQQTDALSCLALFSHVMCYANSAINPVIYNFMSGKFRNEFRRTFCCIPRPLPEQFTTLTRASSRHCNRKSYDMTLNDVKGHANCRHVCTTTFIQNGTSDSLNVPCNRFRNNNSFRN